MSAILAGSVSLCSHFGSPVLSSPAAAPPEHMTAGEPPESSSGGRSCERKASDPDGAREQLKESLCRHALVAAWLPSTGYRKPSTVIKKPQLWAELRGLSATFSFEEKDAQWALEGTFEAGGWEFDKDTWVASHFKRFWSICTLLGKNSSRPEEKKPAWFVRIF